MPESNAKDLAEAKNMTAAEAAKRVTYVAHSVRTSPIPSGPTTAK